MGKSMNNNLNQLLSMVQSRRGSVLEVLIWYFVALGFLVTAYLIFSLYFDKKPISIFMGIFGFFTLLMVFGVLKSYLSKKPSSKKSNLK